MQINDMEIEIRKTWYNKTKVQEDGITHIVDPESHTVYQFGMAKNYFDIESKPEVAKLIAKDLREVANQLDRLADKELEQDEHDLSK